MADRPVFVSAGVAERATDALGTEPTAVAAVALVVALGLLRTYAGPELLGLRFLTFWGTARRIFMPAVDRVAKRAVGVPAENHAPVEEFVGDSSLSPREVADRLQRVTDRRFEVSVLSGLKTDWEGNDEVASIVAYDGPKPWPGAPFWLKPAQYHVTMFDADGATRVTAHYEATSWRPDKWRDHLWKGETFDAERGRRQVEEWLREAHPGDA